MLARSAFCFLPSAWHRILEYTNMQKYSFLRDKGVLATRKDANRVFYRIGDPRTVKLVGMMRDVLQFALNWVCKCYSDC